MCETFTNGICDRCGAPKKLEIKFLLQKLEAKKEMEERIRKYQEKGSIPAYVYRC